MGGETLDLKFLTQKFWYFIWFVALPAMAAGVSAWVLSQFNWFDGPWHVLLAFAVFAVVNYAYRDHFPWWSSPEGQLNARRTQREGELLAKETKRILKRYGRRLSPDTRGEVDRLLQSLETALKEPRPEAIEKGMRRLDSYLQRQLSFARKSAFREYAESIGVAVFIALLLRFFVVEAFKIPSGSMIPTLQIGDHIFVNKFVYGVRLPLTYHFIKENASPRRGEVIVFVFPQDEDKDFIKRIVGVGGDVLEMRDGVLFVNGEEVSQCPVNEVAFHERDELTGRQRQQRGQLFLETMPQGDGESIQYHVMYNPLDDGPRENWGPERVPPGQVYVMGDNRDNSHDSRRWGGVPLENVKGRAWVIWWSHGPTSALRLRFDRIMRSQPLLSTEEQAALQRCDSGPNHH
jgi:signal peptidase I